MAVEQPVFVPLTYDLPVNVQISIEQLERDRGYQVRLTADDWGWEEFLLPLTREDVKNLNTKLQIAVEEVSNRFGENNTDVVKRHEALSELAEKGNYAFNTIFTEFALRDKIQSVLKTCKTIQVSSNDFFIPWELLYDGSLSDQVDVSSFWGMRYIIARNMFRAGNGDAFRSPQILPRPRVGLVAYNRLSHVSDKEVPMLQKLERLERIHLSLLRELDSNQRHGELVAFGNFLGEELEVLHVACEAAEDKVRRDSSILSEIVLSEPYLLVSNEFCIKMDDFAVREFKMQYQPLVILNACLTGTINPLTSSNWAVLFWKRGASAIVATEFHVPDWFAAAFIEELYNQLLSGKPIGEALLDTRHHFCKPRENPLGLAYALYARRTIRIVNAN